ncbi:putative mucin/carbohydrate-binding domain-containing protein [Pseudomonas sp. IT-P176]|uniref:putative mucin/carbohydrate-binding domain-containing protein n=1 Tax=Pseudomonas sp. IT-P176 TaxID=3026444 RepID=UPI0039DF3A28
MAVEEIQRSTHRFYSLERPEWMFRAGLDKGIHHDRIDLGTILLAGTKIRVRQITPTSNVGVTLSLLNNDQKTETHTEIKTQWRELIAGVASVPFVSTRYTAQAGELLEIEVEIWGGAKSLPIYRQGLNIDLFFSDWDSWNAEYALFSSTYANVLIPAKDKGVVKTLHQASGLQNLTSYYNRVFEYFNYLAGLSFEPAVPTDKNIPNRYFMKADKSGVGAAYYGGGWTAETSDSVAAFWLDIRAENWGSLHEISHGYQGGFFSDDIIQVSEIWNNIFCQLYQEKWLGQDVYKVGWLYGAGEDVLYADARRVFDLGLSSAGAAGHLIMFFYMLILWKTGERGLVEFYQRYRRISNSVGFKVADYPAMDLLSHVSIDVANVDVSAFMDYVKVALTGRQAMANAYSNALLVYPLYRLVRQSELAQAQALLGVRSPLHLVSADQLAVTGLTGGITFSFDEDTYPMIAGKVLLIKDAIGQARIIRITSKLVQAGRLPIGAYRLQLPCAMDGEYQGVNCYVANHSDETRLNCTYVRKYASVLADQRIYLGGLSGVFCTLTVDVSTGRLLIQLVQEDPHVYFEDQVYAQVLVRNASGFHVFDRQIRGRNNVRFRHELPIEQGYTIEILHREPSRLKVSNSSASPVIDESAQINPMKVTAQGLVNPILGTLANINLIEEMQRTAELLERSPHWALHDEFPLKQDFRRAINTFSGSIRAYLFERFRTLEFTPPINGRAIAGNRMKWSLQGNGARGLGDITFDLNERTVRLAFAEAVPHEYFASVYMSVVLKSSTGEVRYLREFRGDALAKAQISVLPLSLGDTLSVMHREPTRTGIEVNSDGRKIPLGLVQHATYSAPGILQLSSYWPASIVEDSE